MVIQCKERFVRGEKIKRKPKPFMKSALKEKILFEIMSEIINHYSKIFHIYHISYILNRAFIDKYKKTNRPPQNINKEIEKSFTENI